MGKAGPLSAVRWDGAELLGLTRNETPLGALDYHGQFGIVIKSSSAEILTARVLLVEKD